MAKEARELEQAFLSSLVDETDAGLAEWMRTLESAGLQKNNEIVKWLKSEKAFNHMQASMLAGIFLNDGEPVFHYPTLFRKLFAGKEKQRPLYDAIAAVLQAELPGMLFIPTKTYVSLEDDRVFGLRQNQQDQYSRRSGFGRRSLRRIRTQGRGSGRHAQYYPHD